MCCEFSRGMMSSGAICLFMALAVLSKTSQSAILSPSGRNRLSLVDWNEYNYPQPTGVGTYAFGYDIEDTDTNNIQFRNEERHANGSVTGSYGHLQPDGNVQRVTYIADQFGYRASVEIIPRGSLKPIKLYRPETQLLDFSSRDIPQRQAKVIKSVTMPTNDDLSKKPYPHNIPNYINKHLAKNNYPQVPKFRLERGFVPSYPLTSTKNDLVRKFYKNYYGIPLY